MRFLFFFYILFFPHMAFADPIFEELLIKSLEEMDLNGPIDRWSDRARWSALIPEVSIQGRARQNEDSGTREKSNFFRDEDGELLHEWTQAQSEKDFGNNLSLSLRLKWSLRQLVFSPNELRAESLVAKRRQQKLALIQSLSESYAKWKTLHLQPNKENEEARLYLRLYFDALSGGWFSKNWGKK